MKFININITWQTISLVSKKLDRKANSFYFWNLEDEIRKFLNWRIKSEHTLEKKKYLMY